MSDESIEKPVVVVDEQVVVVDEQVVVVDEQVVVVDEQVVVVEEVLVKEPIVEEEVEEPVVEEVLIEEPVVEEVLVEEPLVEEVLVEEPLVEEVLVEEPVIEEVLVEEPVIEEVLVEEPLVEEVLVEEPIIVDEQKEENITYEQIFEESKQEEYVQEAEQIMEVIKDEPVVEESILEEPESVQLVNENISYEQIFQESEKEVREYVQEAEQIMEVIQDRGTDGSPYDPLPQAPLTSSNCIDNYQEHNEVVLSDVQENYNIVVEPVETKETIPKLIFIVPYRDREEQRRFFDLQMKKVLEDYDYRIIYAHQKDNRSFNRGAMKNIGFLYAKSIFKNDYQNITFVFNDVDTMPFTKELLNYDTTLGNVKHFYGYQFSLGGIVSIKGADFEKTKGFPNYWAWGYEDNAFQRRVLKAGLKIDRSKFYPILDKNILQLTDGLTRIVNRGEYDRYVDEVKYNNDTDGIGSIFHISFNYDDSNNFLNITTFKTPIEENSNANEIHDMRSGAIPFKYSPQQRRGVPRMKMAF